jgi:16S rRNA (cytosine1402-N4)-methyltransferase
MMRPADAVAKESVHRSVLLHEIISVFASKTRPFWYLDGTLGGAGHALALAEAYEEANGAKLNVIGLDRDPQAIERAQRLLEGKASMLILECEDFRNLDRVLSRHKLPSGGPVLVDALLLDLGISSDELEHSGRGFSFLTDEPLLMTMGDPLRYPFTARDIVNGWKEEDIANVIFGYAEERYARRIAKAITVYREKKPIETSGELGEIVKSSVPGVYRRGRIHPATKTFQALRIAVNDELNALREGLAKGYEHLAPGGKMAVISFHSLEDRIVKEFFRSLPAKILTKKPIVPSAQEIAENPRSRSAKLRIVLKS